MIKVMTIFGTRAEAIKMIPIIEELNQNQHTNCIVCVTGQHREMLDQVLDTFNIVPHYDLNIMKQDQSLTEITTKSIIGLEKIITKENPEIILVHGDTNTTLSGALTAFYNKIKIGHIEAGLRTYNKYSPYPEEVNRQLVSRLADIHFAPTVNNKENLLTEGIKEKNIYITGNTIVDLLKRNIKNDYKSFITDWVGDSKMILLTIHRRENIGNNIVNCFNAVKKILNDFPDVKIVYPIHRNQKIRKLAKKHLADIENIMITEPLNIQDFDNIQSKAYIILTDSGGIQETSPILVVPTLVLRDTTERQESIATGVVKIIGTNKNKIYNEVKKLLENPALYNIMKKSSNIYGDGTAAKKIVNILIERYDV